MVLAFRIAAAKYANTLSASGAANRWNKQGEFVIYAASSRSLSSLEMVAHRSNIKPAARYKMMVISMDINARDIATITSDELHVDWQKISGYSKLQEIGSSWYTARKQLVFKVPSALIPQEYNYVINTLHPNFQRKVALEGAEDYFWDPRLIELS